MFSIPSIKQEPTVTSYERYNEQNMATTVASGGGFVCGVKFL